MILLVLLLVLLAAGSVITIIIRIHQGKGTDSKQIALFALAAIALVILTAMVAGTGIPPAPFIH